MAWSIVQAKATDFGESTGNSGSHTLQFASAVHAGNLLVVIAGTGGLGGATDCTVSISDTQVNAWSKAAGYSIDTGQGNVLSAWVATAKSTDGGTPDTVTVSFSAAEQQWMGIAILEISYTGATAFTVDGAVTNHGTGGSCSSGSIPVSGSGELAIAAFSQGNTTETWTPGTGFTNAVEDTNGNNVATYVDYQANVSSAVTDAGTMAGSQAYAALGFSIKATGGGGGGTTNNSPWPWFFDTSVAGNGGFSNLGMLY